MAECRDKVKRRQAKANHSLARSTQPPPAARASELAPMELCPSPTELAPSFSEPEAWLAALAGPDTAACSLHRHQACCRKGEAARALGTRLPKPAAKGTLQLPALRPAHSASASPRRSLHVGISVLPLLLALAGGGVAVRPRAVQHLQQVGALLPRRLHRRHRHAQGPPGAGVGRARGAPW